MKIKLTIFIFTMILSSCFLSDWDGRLILINKSNEKIRWWQEIKNKSDSIPDTTYCDKGELTFILPNHDEMLTTQNRWEFSLRNKPDKILRVYIMSDDSISKYGYCKVYKKQIFKKRYDLTYDDLVKLNWKLVYDGN